MDKRELRSLLAKEGKTQGDLAEYLGLSEQTLSRKINSKDGAEFSQNEISLMKRRFKLTPKQVDSIFFAKIVS